VVRRLAPAGTPPPIIAKLNRQIVRVLNMPDVRASLAADGSERRVIRKAGIKPE